MRWDQAWGISFSGNYSTAVQRPALPFGGDASPNFGSGMGFHFEYQFNIYHRLESGINVQYRSYDFKPTDQLGISYPEYKVPFWYFDVHCKYKMIMHAFRSRVYMAPGVCLSIEQNHPILNRNSSGIGILLTAGYEHSVSKKSYLFAEIEGRNMSVIRFKYEPNPWQILGLQARVGFTFVL
jgi:hypothetical protein